MLYEASTSTPVTNLVIGRVVHKAQIKVTQLGAEATAATGTYFTNLFFQTN